MKRAPYITLILWFLMSYTGNLSAAPVGNIYDPIRWTSSPFGISRPITFMAIMELDNQTNLLPEQIRRPTWIDPNSTINEKRHYPQIRSSQNELSVLGIKLGKPVTSNSIVYAIIGMSQATIDFYYEDWTIVRGFYLNNTYKSEPELYYGLGATILMHEGDLRDGLPYAIGTDIQYRRFNFKDDNRKENGTSYDCTIDEIQLAFSLSVHLKTFSPYAGIKVASITGYERYTNINYESSYYEAGYILYEDDITWSKNIGYFAGVTKTIAKWFSVGFEWRGGDEKALGLNATVRF